MTYEDSVSTWLRLLSDGDESAIEAAFNRYFARLTRLATSKMNGLNQAVRSGEDLALSAFRSFISGVKAQRLVVDEENDLWACLFRIVTRKVCAERRREFAEKRGGKFVRVDSVRTNGDSEEEDFLASLAGREPSPELATEMASNAEEILRIFGRNPKSRRIVELKLSGADNLEIAKEVGVTPRTVSWRLQQIRERFEFVTSAELLFEELFSGASFEAAASRAGWTPEAAKRVVDKALELWSQKSNDIPTFPCEGDYRKTLDAWVRYTKGSAEESWTDCLQTAFAPPKPSQDSEDLEVLEEQSVPSESNN